MQRREQRPPSRIGLLGALGGAILLAAVLAVYWNAIDTPFIYDDASSVTDNRSIQRLWPLWSLGDSPLHPSPFMPTSARPLANLSLAINYYFGGLDPRGYHAFNIVLHAASALLLALLVRRTLMLDFFGGRFEPVAGLLGWSAALVWAVHPLASETVVYVTQRTEGMVGLCYLAAVYCSLRYWAADGPAASGPANRALWLGGAAVAGCLGALSKEVIATLPLVVLLYERTFMTGSFRRALARSWPLYACLAFCWLPLAIIYANEIRTPQAGFGQGVAASAWWLVQAKVLFMYLELAIWPWPLSIRHGLPYPRGFAAAWPWVAAAVSLVGATSALVWRRRALGLVVACVLIILLPTLVVPLVGEVAAERRMYLPLAVIVAAAVAGGYDVLRRAAPLLERRGVRLSARAGRLAIVGGVLVLAVLFAAVTVRRVAVYGSELALWEDAEQLYPHDSIVHAFEGVLLRDQGRHAEAREHFERAIRFDPRQFHAQYNLASYLVEAGETTGAIAHYEAALVTNPASLAANLDMARLMVKVGKPGRAIGHYELVLRAEPNSAKLHVELGVALAATGQAQRAIEHFERAAQLKPSAETRWNLAVACSQANRPADAINHAQQALVLARESGQTALAARIEEWLNSRPK